MTHRFNKESVVCANLVESDTLTYASESEAGLMYNKHSRLTELYKHYWDDLCGLFKHKLNSSSYDYEDAIQSAFIKYAQMERCEQVTDPRAYLYRLSQNNFIDQHRRQQCESAYVDAVSEDLDKDHQSPEQILCSKQKVEILEASVKTLSEEQKAILVMHRIEEKTYAEIAKCLNCSTAHVSRQLNRILVFLSKELALAGGEHE